MASICRIKAARPFWGYRRVWAYVRYVEQQMVTQKRIYRLLKLHGLLVPPKLRLKASRTANRRKPQPTAPNPWWGIDMTTLLIDGFGWVYVALAGGVKRRRAAAISRRRQGPRPLIDD